VTGAHPIGGHDDLLDVGAVPHERAAVMITAAGRQGQEDALYHRNIPRAITLQQTSMAADAAATDATALVLMVFTRMTQTEGALAPEIWTPTGPENEGVTVEAEDEEAVMMRR